MPNDIHDYVNACNHLNQPKEIMVSKDTLSGSITYIYDAEGNKLQKQVLENQQLHTTDYLGGFQYLDGKIDFIPHAEGYVKAVHTGNTTEFHYVYNYTDHLGNIRLSYGRDPETDEVAILKESHYYPFGLQHNGYVSNHMVFEPRPGGRVNLTPVRNYLDDTYRYDFNAKEHQPELGLNWHEYHARNYDAALGRWMNVDPLGEEYASYSPYSAMGNNPIYYIDPDGRTIQVFDYEDNERTAYEWRDHKNTWGFYDKNNTLYTGANTFIEQLSEALTGLMSGGDVGFNLVNDLANHSNVVTLMYSNRSVADSQNQVGWNPTGERRSGSLEAVPTTEGSRIDPMITLGHELGHIDYNWNVGVNKTWFSITVADKNENPTQRPVSTSEIHATHIENKLRSENNLPLRTHYGVDQSGKWNWTTNNQSFNKS